MAAADYEITDEELQRLKALRRAAADIHSSSVMRDTGSVRFSLSARVGGATVVERHGHDPERFRSFMIALRRTYSENDLANFRAAAKVVSRRVEALRPRLKTLREGYQDALRSEQISLNGLSHEGVFRAWLYGSVFHDDDDQLRAQWEALTSNPLLSGMADTVVEATALVLAEHVLALDDIVADVLGETRLPATRHAVLVEHPRAIVEVELRPHRQRSVLWIDFVNRGTSEARDVTLDRFTPLTAGDEDVLIEGELERKLPVPRLRPGERVSLMAAVSMGSPTDFEAVLSWGDENGVRASAEYRLDLLSALG